MVARLKAVEEQRNNALTDAALARGALAVTNVAFTRLNEELKARDEQIASLEAKQGKDKKK